MFLPDFTLVLEELWQLSLTVASLKYIAGMVTEELGSDTQQASTGHEEVTEGVHRQSSHEYNEITISEDVNREHEAETENDEVMIDEDYSEITIDNGYSQVMPMISHSFQDTASDDTMNTQVTTSLTSHFLIVMDQDDVQDTGSISSMLAHQLMNIPDMEEDVVLTLPLEEAEADLFSMASHQLPDTETPMDDSPLPSMASHQLLPACNEEPDTGILTSMLVHQSLDTNEETIEVPPLTVFLEGEIPTTVDQENVSMVTHHVSCRELALDSTLASIVSVTAHIGSPVVETDSMILPSMVVHHLLQSDEEDNILHSEEEDSTPLSMVTHQEVCRDVMTVMDDPFPSMASHTFQPALDVDMGVYMSMVAHQIYADSLEEPIDEVSTKDQDEQFQWEEVPVASQVTHQLLRPDLPPNPSNTLVSMAAHSSLHVEGVESGLQSSIVAHQVSDSNMGKEEGLSVTEDISKGTFLSSLGCPQISPSSHPMEQEAKDMVSLVAHNPCSLEGVDNRVDGITASLLSHQPFTGEYTEYSADAKMTTVDSEENLSSYKLSNTAADPPYQSMTSHQLLPVQNEESEPRIQNSIGVHQSPVTSEETEDDYSLDLSSEDDVITILEHDHACVVTHSAKEEILEPAIDVHGEDFLPSAVCHQVPYNMPPLEEEPREILSLVSHNPYSLESVENIEDGITVSLLSHNPLLITEEFPTSEYSVENQNIKVEIEEEIISMTGHQLPNMDISKADGTLPSMASHQLTSLQGEEQDTGLQTSMMVHQLSTRDSGKEVVMETDVCTGDFHAAPLTDEALIFMKEKPYRAIVPQYLEPERKGQFEGVEEEMKEDNKHLDIDDNKSRDPREASAESMSTSSHLCISSSIESIDDDPIETSFDNFVDASKMTYNEKMADEYKSTIQRIQELQKFVGEEIGQFETTRKELRKSPVVTTVISNVKGISFPLEISIHQNEPNEQSSLLIGNIKESVEEETSGSMSYIKLDEEDHNKDTNDISIPKLVSASCVFGDNSPVLIRSSTENFSCDSGFNSSPDVQIRTDDTDKCNISRDEVNSNLFSKQPPLPPQRRNTEEKKMRDKELLESFLRNENHQKRKETMVMTNPGQQINPQKKDIPAVPKIPLPTVRELPGQKKHKIKKSKLTTAGIKESLRKRTYKIRFHVNLNPDDGINQAEKPSVLECFLKFFKLDKFFSKK